jgi:hypothetical protein
MFETMLLKLRVKQGIGGASPAPAQRARFRLAESLTF